MPDGALAQFGDIGHRALIMIGFDALPNSIYKVIITAVVRIFHFSKQTIFTYQIGHIVCKAADRMDIALGFGL